MKGPKLLKRFLRSENISDAAMGRLARIDPSLITRYKLGSRRPDIDRAFAIEDATEQAVPARAWTRRNGLGKHSAA